MLVTYPRRVPNGCPECGGALLLDMVDFSGDGDVEPTADCVNEECDYAY